MDNGQNAIRIALKSILINQCLFNYIHTIVSVYTIVLICVYVEQQMLAQIQ